MYRIHRRRLFTQRRREIFDRSSAVPSLTGSGAILPWCLLRCRLSTSSVSFRENGSNYSLFGTGDRPWTVYVPFVLRGVSKNCTGRGSQKSVTGVRLGESAFGGCLFLYFCYCGGAVTLRNLGVVTSAHASATEAFAQLPAVAAYRRASANLLTRSPQQRRLAYVLPFRACRVDPTSLDERRFVFASPTVFSFFHCRAVTFSSPPPCPVNRSRCPAASLAALGPECDRLLRSAH